jgi:lysozyme family protein
MKSNFDAALIALLKTGREGGFSNNPADPGGMTNLGVTKRVWEAWVGHPVTEAAMRALTPALVAPLYRLRYWDAASCNDLPAGIDYAVFDCAVNSGPGRAIKLLQEAVGATPDGAIGPNTLAAVAKQEPVTLINAYNMVRLTFMKSLPAWADFKNGWTRRVVEVTAESMSLVA